MPLTHIASANDLQTDDWITPGAAGTWTAYVPFGANATTHLRDTNRTLESRARNLWNWNQRDMAGNQTQDLKEQDCLALLDWIHWHSTDNRADHERLLQTYTVVMGPGTGNFAGKMQLKIINLDPAVPAVMTEEFDQHGRRMKRPTFHLNVDLDASARQRIQQALIDRGFVGANH